jgi:nucleosome assembly protein 1-like 1
MLTKTVQKDSFFNFFNPPEVAEGETPDDETEQLLGADFEIGHFIRERIVPRAVLYFTGEAMEEDVSRLLLYTTDIICFISVQGIT